MTFPQILLQLLTWGPRYWRGAVVIVLNWPASLRPQLVTCDVLNSHLTHRLRLPQFTNEPGTRDAFVEEGPKPKKKRYTRWCPRHWLLSQTTRNCQRLRGRRPTRMQWPLMDSSSRENPQYTLSTHSMTKARSKSKSTEVTVHFEKQKIQWDDMTSRRKPTWKHSNSAASGYLEDALKNRTCASRLHAEKTSEILQNWRCVLAQHGGAVWRF